MDWFKDNLNNPMFLLAIAVVVIAIWMMYGKGKMLDIKSTN